MLANLIVAGTKAVPYFLQAVEPNPGSMTTEQFKQQIAPQGFKATSVKRLIVLGTLVVLALVAVSSVWARSDPRIGTWKLNLAKSKFSPGPAPASETRRYEAQGSMILTTVERDYVLGKHTTQRNSGTKDGKNYPTKLPIEADTIAIKLVSPNNWEGVAKKGGKVILTIRAVLSKDGKVFTLTTTGTNAQGQRVNNIAVYDRQEMDALQESEAVAFGTKPVETAGCQSSKGGCTDDE
jgi:hypothetical protein